MLSAGVFIFNAYWKVNSLILFLQALVRFNEMMTKNSQLREEIETLRMERVRFQQLRRKLEKVLISLRFNVSLWLKLSKHLVVPSETAWYS